MGVIGDPATAMRDPLFYRLHKFTDSFFQQYKSTLQPYSNEQVRLFSFDRNSIPALPAAVT